MPTATVKDAARAIVEQLPEQATWDDVMYEFYVKQKIDHGLADVAAGRVHDHDVVRAELLGDDAD